MPIRTASLSRQIQKNGSRLHLAMMARARSQGVDEPPSDQEKALMEERRLLKVARGERQARAKLPRQKPARFVPTVRPLKAPKAPKAPKAAKEPHEAKAGKGNKPSRADKLTKKAENLEAAKKSAKKSAKT